MKITRLKKLVSMMIVTILMAGSLSTLTACQAPAEKAEDKPSIKVITTIFAPYDFAKQIAGPLAEVSLLLPPGAESHSFDPTPQDMKKIQNADLFIYVGSENEAWVETLLDSMGDEKPKTLRILDCVSLLEEEEIEGMEHEHDHDHEGEGTHEHEIDEHIWTSLRNSMKIAVAIAGKLTEIDSANGQTYKANSEAYIDKLSALDNEIAAIVKNGKNKPLIFGDRFPFRYFVEDYGLNYFAAFTGCSTDTEASAATIAFLINKIKEEKTPVVFYIEFSNQKIAEALCEGTGAKKLLFHSCHNISKDDYANGVTYLDLMDANAENLKEALK